MKPPENPDSLQLDLWSAKESVFWEDYRVAREYVRSLGLGNRAKWESWVNNGNLRNTRIPENPEKAYLHRGWTDWQDWLGTDEPEEIVEPGQSPLTDDSQKDLWSGQKGSKWMNFHEARRIARGYGFEYREEWKLFTDGKFTAREPLPENVPEDPERIYRFVGWQGWKDWLIDPEKQVEYSDFSRAREFVRSSRIGGKDSWRDFLHEKADVLKEYGTVLPLRPHLEYADSGWVDWEDWLGTNTEFGDFASTRKFVRSLKLKNRKAWSDFCAGRLPNRPAKSKKIYTYPELAFRNEGWKGWDDWLGSPGTENNPGAGV